MPAPDEEMTSATADADIPRRTEGLELLGRYQGAEYENSVFLARRGDGQMVQLSFLLFLVAQEIDGARNSETIAERVGQAFGKDVSADNIRHLVARKLHPLGVIAEPGAPTAVTADAPRNDLLLGLMGRHTLVPPAQVRTAARALAWLHRPTVTVLVLGAALAMDGWLFLVHGAIPALLDTLSRPLPLLTVFALIVASLVFHEFGHASACHHAGATPGRIGCGLYLIWPSLYTDVTDVYRATRAGRLRTDLGGVYFNVVFMLLLLAAYAGTGHPVFLAAIYLGHFEIFEQLMPTARLDGYYILTDVAGVPDLYGRIGPLLRGLLPRRVRSGRPAEPVPVLTRRARTIVTVWVLTLVPLMLADLGYGLWNLPRITSTALGALADQAHAATTAAGHEQLWSTLVALIDVVLLALPFVGTGWLLLRLLRATARKLRPTREPPVPARSLGTPVNQASPQAR
ncbi:hypothetical protein [Streptomyces sp. NPDC087294]|uniref:hypothetical protein n=1 Tax=Streptomyces sp. NPDC087294 TaxID=3365777 RepID=UPI003823C9DE